MSLKGVDKKMSKNMNLKQLKVTANAFLSSKKNATNLVDIIQYFQVSML